jgi:homoserine dehydrogenase
MCDKDNLAGQDSSPEYQIKNSNTHTSPFTAHSLKVALLGFGNVGRSFARYANQQSSDKRIDISIGAIADSSGGLMLDTPGQVERLIASKESFLSIKDVAPGSVITSATEFINSLQQSGISAIVESLPTNLEDGQPALDLIMSALAQGINVVTVDKGPLVYGLDALKESARKGGSRFGYSGTTGVSIPEKLRDERVIEIRGVLNGTTNYMLTAMQQERISFNEALAYAQTDGIAEPDPALDVAGWDTAAKILILAKTLMGTDARLAEVSRIGIGPETDSLIQTGRDSNRVVRLVGRARIWQGRVRVSVAPKLIREDSPFFSVEGTSKLALFRTEGEGEVLSFARSGRDAISQTILDDLLRLPLQAAVHENKHEK